VTVPERPDQQRSVKELVERTRDGDVESLGALFDRFAPEVHRVAFYLTASRDDADDVVQDVFVGLPEALRGLGDTDRMAPWLRRVTARTALMRMRTERRRGRWEAAGAREEAGPAPATIDKVALMIALAQLPPVLRAVFVLKEIEGYSHAEIASLLTISIANSEVRLHRARRMLRARLEA
jgi:RNA polymerase sigma-70 factor, ECF subfamily